LNIRSISQYLPNTCLKIDKTVFVQKYTIVGHSDILQIFYEVCEKNAYKENKINKQPGPHI
jgi:hypothetical protein